MPNLNILMKRNLLNSLVLFMSIAMIFMACRKSTDISLSTVSTLPPLAVSSSAATLAISVESDGGSHIIDCGFYIGTSQDPETSGQRFQVGSDTGIFVGQLSGLTPDVQYFAKAFAKNGKGENLGSLIDFHTPATVKDYDNNVYETVQLANQVWMAENLKTTTYRNGDPIGTTTPATADITGESNPKYQWPYDGSEANADLYGRLYTAWALSDSRGLCPTGWHVPSDPEWTILTDLLGGETYGGGYLKERGTANWDTPNEGATNETLFNALPGGSRNDASGTFTDSGAGAYFWSSTDYDSEDTWYRHLTAGSVEIGRIGGSKKAGFSVRCIKDL